jgi:hypothetical protein
VTTPPPTSPDDQADAADTQGTLLPLDSETNLQHLPGYPFAVFVSEGGATRGGLIAERAARTARWVDQLVGLPPVPPLFVVGVNDWAGVAQVPMYGMPHIDDDRLVVGQESAPFWVSIRDVLVPRLGSQAGAALRATYGETVDVASFADLLVSHEVVHLAHGLTPSANPVTFWVRELVANLGLQGYVSEIEPNELAHLETLFDTTWKAHLDHWPVRELPDMMDSLEGDGTNYVWFQFGLHVLSKRLWQSAGALGFTRLVDVLRGPELSQEQLEEVLRTIDEGAADAVSNWPLFDF